MMFSKILVLHLFKQGLWNFSPPSEPSATMTAKTRFAKATFKQPGMYDIEVRAGKTFRFEIFSFVILHCCNFPQIRHLVLWGARARCVLGEERMSAGSGRERQDNHRRVPEERGVLREEQRGDRDEGEPAGGYGRLASPADVRRRQHGGDRTRQCHRRSPSSSVSQPGRGEGRVLPDLLGEAGGRRRNGDNGIHGQPA